MSKMKCSVKQAVALDQKSTNAYARSVGHELVRDALLEEGREPPKRLVTSFRASVKAHRAADRKRRACGRPVLVRGADPVELAQKYARQIAKRLKIKVVI